MPIPRDARSVDLAVWQTESDRVRQTEQDRQDETDSQIETEKKVRFSKSQSQERNKIYQTLNFAFYYFTTDVTSLYKEIHLIIFPQATTDGLTGNVFFVEGRRSKFKLDILKLKQERIQKVGYWEPDGGVNISDPTAFYDSNIANITLVVMTREVSIYFSYKV